MKRRKNPFVLLCAMLLTVFLLNMAVMYVFFDINLLHLPELLWKNMELNRSGGGGSVAGYEDETGDPNSAAGSTDLAAANDAEAGSESAGSDPEPDSTGTGYFLTRAQISSFEHLSLDDSLIALDIASRIGMEESKRIFDMSLDGITVEEYEEIKKSVGDKLSESDIIAIEKLLNRSLIASGNKPGDK